MKKHFLPMLLIFNIFFSSCNTESRKLHVSFPDYKQHGSIDSITIKPLLIYPINMVANENHLIVLNHGTDTLFQVFSQPECNYLGWFGQNGKGPREFLMNNPSSIRFYSNWVQVSDLRKIYYLEIPSGKINDNYILKEWFHIPGELLAFNQIFRLDTNKICGINQVRKSPQSVDYFNPVTNVSGSFVDYPDFGIKVPENAKREVYNYRVELKPDRSSFVLIYSFFPLLRICDKNGNVVHETYIDGLPKQIKYKGLGKKEGNFLSGISYYVFIKTTNQYIYLLYEPYQGERINEHEFTRKPIGQKELHIFDWNGKPVVRMKLMRGTRSIAPSTDDKYLFCVNDYAIDKIFRYHLSDILSPQNVEP